MRIAKAFVTACTRWRILNLSHHSGEFFLYSCDFGSKSKSWIALINTSAGSRLSPSCRSPSACCFLSRTMLRWIKLQGTSQRIAEVPSQNTGICVYVYMYVYLKHTYISSFSFVMRKTCAHPLDSLVWAAMTATPQKQTRTWLLKLFKEQLPCRVIFKIKFLTSSSKRERE